MTFAQPLWLLAAAAALAATAGLLARASRARRRQLSAFLPHADAALQAHVARGTRHHLARLALLGLGIVALFVAAARPQGAASVRAGESHGVNLVVALDASRSMGAEDASPSRLRRAQELADAVLARVPGSRVAVLAFSGDPIVLAPPTFDTVSARVIARSVSLELAGRGGTELTGAITRAARLLGAMPADQPRLLLVLSDGENQLGDPLLEALKQHRAAQLRVHTVTVGSAAGSSVPRFVRAADRSLRRDGVVTDAAGQPVVSRAAPALLGELAAATGGLSWTLPPAGELAALADEIVARAITPVATALRDGPRQTERREWFWLPLLVALACWLGEPLVAARPPRQSPEARR